MTIFDDFFDVFADPFVFKGLAEKRGPAIVRNIQVMTEWAGRVFSQRAGEGVFIGSLASASARPQRSEGEPSGRMSAPGD
jgi:hypothetical protein